MPGSMRLATAILVLVLTIIRHDVFDGVYGGEGPCTTEI